MLRRKRDILNSGPPAVNDEGDESDVDNDYEFNEESTEDTYSDVSLDDECEEVDNDRHGHYDPDSDETWLLDSSDKETGLIKMVLMTAGQFGGVMLSANALDRDNGIFPIAFSVWKRYYFRNMLGNFKLTFKDNSMNENLWSIVRVGSKSVFTECIKALGSDSMDAVLWLMKKPCDKWEIHAFECDIKSDHITNNMSECFNNLIKDERDKPILTLVEHLRRKIMVRFLDKCDEVEKLKDSITPYAREKLSANEKKRKKVASILWEIDHYADWDPHIEPVDDFFISRSLAMRVHLHEYAWLCADMRGSLHGSLLGESEKETDWKLIDDIVINGEVTKTCRALKFRDFTRNFRLTEMRNKLKDLFKTPEGDWHEGKLTRHDHFDTLGLIEDALNRVPKDFVVKDRCRFMAFYFGHFMTMDRRMKFSGGVIHRLLLRELHHECPTDEMRFLLGNHLVKFSNVEFYLITGLHFDVVPDTT
ncbi:hypothetical protein Ddye_022867 [Dipteronia dyeriana]|uniref:Uncharacterized protein n=1 Tax=Dipteronia dyeriana TaxID=168575 RepID=A0AAD9TSR6_9ROSI|nr:hypothetical protein Ddye_022867 [Dipteronia dyeriana]